MGEELSADERVTFTNLTGREREPLQRVDQFAAVVGRRGGKSRAMAVLATYIVGLCDHSDALVTACVELLLTSAVNLARGLSCWRHLHRDITHCTLTP